MYCGETSTVTPIVVVGQIPVNGIFGGCLVEGEVKGVLIFAVKHPVTGRADTDKVAFQVVAAFAARDIVVQMEGTSVPAEDTGVAIAGIDGFPGFGGDAFGCAQHGRCPLSKDAA